MFKTALALGPLVASLALLSCDVTQPASPPPTDPADTIYVWPVEATLVRGATLQLNTEAWDAQHQYLGQRVHWTSSDTTKATVTDSGFVLVRDSGSITLTATRDRATSVVHLQSRIVTFTTVSPAKFHTCGLATTGEAFCWGLNLYGGLGVEDRDRPHTTPGPVRGGLRFNALSSGYLETCALTAAHAGYCWGTDNSNGEMGSAAATPDTLPTPIVGGLAFSALSAGGLSGCGLVTDGTPYCWGAFPANNEFAPVRISDTLHFTVLSAGDGSAYGNGSACALTSQGSAYCWGDDYYGQLGSDSVPPYTYGPFAVEGGLTFTVISAGGTHACAITLAHLAYCWGQNTTGELGTGDTVWASTPVPVAGGLAWSALSAGGGGGNTCGITTGGKAYCWGGNNYGQLGIGTIDATFHTLPEPVIGNLTFRTIETRNAATCGITTDGVAYCWGANYYGQLGVGTYTDTPIPTRVVGQP